MHGQWSENTEKLAGNLHTTDFFAHATRKTSVTSVDFAAFVAGAFISPFFLRAAVRGLSYRRSFAITCSGAISLTTKFLPFGLTSTHAIGGVLRMHSRCVSLTANASAPKLRNLVNALADPSHPALCD